MSEIANAVGRIAHAFDASDSRRADVRALALRVFDLDEQNARLEEERYLVEARIAAAVAEEREACAKLAEDVEVSLNRYCPTCINSAAGQFDQLADAIRARGGK